MSADAPLLLALHSSSDTLGVGVQSLPLAGHLAKRRLSGVQPLAEWAAGAALPDNGGWNALQGRTVMAVAGLAVPGRFFEALRAQGLRITERPMPDHHDYAAVPWTTADLPVVVTEKDAVKLCGRTDVPDADRVWVARLDLAIEAPFWTALDTHLEALRRPVDGSPPA